MNQRKENAILLSEIAAKVAHLHNGMVRKASVEHGLDPTALMLLVREERRARGLDPETGLNKRK